MATRNRRRPPKVLSYFKLIKGTFLLLNAEPDGDSLRFKADNLDLYDDLKNSFRIKPNKAGTVQLRLEGIDAPELHYGADAQPLSRESRDELLVRAGFTNVLFGGKQNNTVTASTPTEIRGGIFTKGAEINGRPISYIITETFAGYDDIDDGDILSLNKNQFTSTINYHMLLAGMAYPTFYTSTPKRDRRLLLEAATTARENNRGIWQADETNLFSLEDQNSIGPQGALILPKLFRRCTDYLKAVEKGYNGNLDEWLVDSEYTKRNENDRVVVYDQIEVKLSDLIRQQNSRIQFQADLFDIVFIEK